MAFRRAKSTSDLSTASCGTALHGAAAPGERLQALQALQAASKHSFSSTLGLLNSGLGERQLNEWH